MKKNQCQMCDREISNAGGKHGWCDQCETEFARVTQKVECKSADGDCESPITCSMRKRCTYGEGVCHEC